MTPGNQDPQTPSGIRPAVVLPSLKRRRQYRLRRRSYAFNAAEFIEDEPSGHATLSNLSMETLTRERLELEKKVAALEEKLVREQERTSAAAAEADSLRGQISAHSEAALRARAEMENQRRRHQRERDEYRKVATSDLMEQLLSPLDHFELALRSANENSDAKSIAQGVQMILRELQQVLAANGLERVYPLNAPFDPHFHEAIGAGDDPERPENTVLEVARPGWVLSGRVLRAAMVRVNVPSKASGTPAPASDNAAPGGATPGTTTAET